MQHEVRTAAQLQQRAKSRTRARINRRTRHAAAILRMRLLPCIRCNDGHECGVDARAERATHAPQQHDLRDVVSEEALRHGDKIGKRAKGGGGGMGRTF